MGFRQGLKVARAVTVAAAVMVVVGMSLKEATGGTTKGLAMAAMAGGILKRGGIRGREAGGRVRVGRRPFLSRICGGLYGIVLTCVILEFVSYSSVSYSSVCCTTAVLVTLECAFVCVYFVSSAVSDAYE